MDAYGINYRYEGGLQLINYSLMRRWRTIQFQTKVLFLAPSQRRWAEERDYVLSMTIVMLPFSKLNILS